MSATEYAALLEEKRRLEARIADDESLLERASNIILSRQQYVSLIVIREKYRDLCLDISQWVDVNLGDAIYDQLALKERRFELKAAERLLSLIPASGKEAFDEPESDLFNISAVVMNFFRREVFEPQLYGCLDEEVAKTFATIEKNMAAARYGRTPSDKYFNREWHISTYAGIISDGKFPVIRAQRKEEILPTLVSMMLILNPHPDIDGFKNSLGKLLDDAMSLAEKIHGSLDEWEFVYSRYRDTRAKDRSGPVGEFDAFIHWNILSLGAKLKVDPGQDDRRYVLDVYPDLYETSLEKGTRAGDIIGGNGGTILVACQTQATKIKRVMAPSVLKWLDDTVQLSIQRPPRQRRGGL
ncbi:hypothetical protein VTL71DRAFT_9556 [Oculimacula yallundae]|uniref:Uncharacterized protein n=1 Tax=Oculimacula yallundae TaxID=86028 RepID=A0ABR4BR56_9HELO